MKLLKIVVRQCLFLTAVLLIIFTGCREQSGELQQIRGGTVRVILNGSIDDICPLTSREYYSRQVHEYLLNPSFVSFDSEGNAQPQLAVAWQLSEDKKRLTFLLNKTLRWSDGQPVSARDALFTWQQIRNLPNSRYTNDLVKIDSLKILDTGTIQFLFTQPVSNPLNITNFPLLPAAWSGKLMQTVNLDSIYRSDFIGCGPYLLKSINRDSLVVIRNEKFSEQGANLDEIRFIFMRDRQELANIIRGNRADVIIDVPIELSAVLAANKQYRIESYPERSFTMLGWNLNRGLFDDVRLRRALALAIDRQTLVDGVLGGFSSVVDGPVYPQLAPELRELPELEYNPERADSLLISMGWLLDETNSYRVRDGEKLQFRLSYSQENPVRQAIAVNIKSDLAKIGCQVDFQPAGWNDILNQIESKDFDALLITWVDENNYDPARLFHSRNIDGGMNFMSYHSGVSDSLLQLAGDTDSEDQRQTALKQFLQTIYHDQPGVFLYNQQILSGVRQQVNGVVMDTRGFLVNVKDWWLGIR
jgi:peptide/nickel transport system substrate-binding protein